MLSLHLTSCLRARRQILSKGTLSIVNCIRFTHDSITFLYFQFLNDYVDVLNLGLFWLQGLSRLISSCSTDAHVSATSYLLLDLDVLFELSLVFATAMFAEIFFWECRTNFLIWLRRIYPVAAVRMLAFWTLLFRSRSAVTCFDALYTSTQQVSRN